MGVGQRTGEVVAVDGVLATEWRLYYKPRLFFFFFP